MAFDSAFSVTSRSDVRRRLRTLSRWALTTYLGLVLAGLVVAVARLSQSAEMPGLGAIELLLLALPWSLALGVAPFSRFGLGGVAFIVLGGVVLKALALRWIARLWPQRR